MARVVMRIVVGDSEADQTREVLRDLAYRVHTRDPGQSAGVDGCHVKCLTLEEPMAGRATEFNAANQ